MIQYKAGLTNRAADALSRRDHPDEEELVAISICKPVWLEAIRNSYHSDLAAKQKLTSLSLDPNSEADFTLQDGVLRFKGRVWIGDDTVIQQNLINS